MRAPAPTSSSAAPDAGQRRSAEPGAEEAAATSPEARDDTGATAARAPAPPGGRWWQSFDDRELDALVERALAHNRDLRVAWARIAEAQALAGQTRAARYPQISGSGQANWSRSVFGFLGTTATQTTLRASLPVTYEVDWWARNAAGARAASLDTEAARADMEAAAISVAAEVAEAWFDLLESRARSALLDEQSRVNASFLELTMLRFDKGLTSSLDVHQQRQQVAATHAQRARVDTSALLAANQLAVLMGEPPEGERLAEDRRALPDVAPLPEQGLPASLISQRPDLRAASKRSQAADERVAVAIRGRLPKLTLSGSPGYTWNRFEATSGGLPVRKTYGPAYELGAVLDIPLFDGLLRRSQVEQSEAGAARVIESYAQVIVKAVQEVDTALAAEQNQAREIAALSDQLAAARDSLDVAREQYRQGLSDFLPVLQALGSVQQTELALLASRRQRLSYRVQLHRALGGDWASELEPPPADPSNGD